MDTRGRLYAAGVGPGDPEYMTLKACRLIRECDIVAVPAKDPHKSVAYRTAAAAVPELKDKEIVGLSMPMVREKALLEASRREAADRLEELLDKGKNIAYLTLGDVVLYSTFGYLKSILEEDGYEVSLISGVSSLSAAAARLGIFLAEGDEELHVIPGVRTEGSVPGLSGTLAVMKLSGRVEEVREALRRSGREAAAVENCGMEGETVYPDIDGLPEDAGYLSIVISPDR